MFVIIAVRDDEPNKNQFYAIDNASGGYPYWATTLTQAKYFKIAEDAIKELKDSWFEEEMTFDDGTIFPPSGLWNGGGICNARSEGSVEIMVQEVIFQEPVWKQNYDLKIKMKDGSKGEEDTKKNNMSFEHMNEHLIRVILNGKCIGKIRRAVEFMAPKPKAAVVFLNYYINKRKTILEARQELYGYNHD